MRKRWVVKIGSSLITADGEGLDREAIAHWASQLAQLQADGVDLVLVCSGAVAEGIVRLGWRERPAALHLLQVAAAVGQTGVVEAWARALADYGLQAAQVLLTHEDLSYRQRYLNVKSALQAMVARGVLPVINENDTVTTDEIRFGDNDSLAALVANLVAADTLLILTDQPGLFDKDPRQHHDAQLIKQGYAEDQSLRAVAGDGGKWGRGGMVTKLLAAERAARSGTTTVIAPGAQPGVLWSIYQGEPVGTCLLPSKPPLEARKQWLANQLQLRGALHIDAGAARVLRSQGSSLLAAGVLEAQGRFRRGELVSIHGPDGVELARGLVNYSIAATQKLCGESSTSFARILGYVAEPELVHRDNMVVFSQ